MCTIVRVTISWAPVLHRGSEPGNDDRPLYLSVADAISKAVAEGALRPGDQLPTHRALAQQLVVTVGTVTRAYAEAERRGLIAGQIGRGTFVRAGRTPFTAGHPATLAASATTAPSRPRSPIPATAVPTAAEVTGTGAGPRPVDLSVVRPPSGGINVTALLAELLADPAMAAAAVGVDTPTDSASHREAGARWAEHGGWTPDPAALVLTAGAQHGITVTLAATTQPGDAVATDELTNPGLLAAAALLHVTVVGVTRDADGPLPASLDAACRARPVRAVYLQPNLHNPTAITMSVARRSELATVAERHGLVVIEDDPLGPLDPGRPAPIAALLPAQTLHLSGVSKLLAPGLQVGFAAVPTAWHSSVLAAVRASTWTISPLMAEVVARWIADGTVEWILASRRQECDVRRTLARQVLPVSPADGAPHFWLDLPEPWRPSAFIAAAGAEGVAVSSGEDYAVGRSPAAYGVRIGLGGEYADLARGLDVIARLLTTPRPPAPDR